MLPFQIQTYNGSQEPAANRIYILTKGNNSGKPRRTPYRNSLALTFKSEAEADRGFYAIKSLFLAQVFKRQLIGSVIPFIRLTDVIMIFKVYIHLFENDFPHYEQIAAATVYKDKLKKQYESAIRLIQAIAISIIH